MSRTLVLHAHPRPSQSVVTSALLGTLRQGGPVQVRSLYELYPDFDIDVDVVTCPPTKRITNPCMVAF